MPGKRGFGTRSGGQASGGAAEGAPPSWPSIGLASRSLAGVSIGLFFWKELVFRKLKGAWP